MRARKPVVLWCRTPNEVSDWRLRMELRSGQQAGVRVLAALSLQEAREHLVNTPEALLVVTTVAGNLGIDLLKRGDVRVLLVGCTKEQAEGTRADGFEVDGPVLVGRVLEKLRLMLARKRGPKKQGTDSSALLRSDEQELARRAA